MRELSNLRSDKASEISRRLELAMLFEVSAYPKPGNVHRTRDYPDTRFEHFVASAVACRSSFEIAAEKGSLISKRELHPQDAQVGSTIRDAVISTIRSQRGGNTSLGTLTLLVPLAVAAGMAFTQGRLQLHRLRRDLSRVLKSTTATDTVAFYEAVLRAKAGGLGRVPQLDLRNPSSKKEILRNELGLLDVFRLAADHDSICSEWITDYSTTFELGYPYFRKELSKTDDINVSTVNTYLRILSQKPDTLIARKAGIERAKWVSTRSKEALALGGAKTIAGRMEIERLDDELGKNGNLLNPGATADLSACVVALATLSGYRP
jgi:triphosphoribosyl-dephospho-CoA synthase